MTTSLLKETALARQETRSTGPGQEARQSSPAEAEELRVVLFSPLFPEYAARLARALDRHALVRLVADRSGYEAECRGTGLESDSASRDWRWYRLFLRRSGMFGAARDLMRTLIDMWAFKPSIVHFQECPNVAHYLLVRLMKPTARIVVTVHDPMPHSGRDLKADRPIIRRRIRASADLLLAHGHYCCSEVARLAGSRGARVRETTHGVVLRPPAELVREPVPGRVLLFGRMEHYKGTAVLIDAVELLIRRGVPVSLHLAGRGPELERLAGRWKSLPGVTVSDGFLTPDVAIQAFQEASVVALPYLDATQSGVVAAAFANGRPVVASRVGGLTDVVMDGVNGLLADPGQPESLAYALERALSSPKLLARLRRGAERTAATSMNWDAIAARTAGYYRELLEPRRTR